MRINVIRLERNHMATTFELVISCPEARTGLASRTLSEADQLIAQLEDELSEFREPSPVYRLNHSSAGERIVFGEAGFELLRRSFALRELSNGAFDPLAKSSQQEEPGLEWNPETREVWKKTSGTWLGFGAIGKGYAIDRARTLIEDAGFDSYLVSAGGSSVALSGREAPSRPWKWGWSWKKNSQGENLGIPLTHWSGKRVALGVSGTHEKGSHLIGAGSGIKSALVALPSAADADALSTALFVSGWERSKEFMAKLPLAPGAGWIDEEETPHWNGVFQNLWKEVAALALAAIAFAGALAASAPRALCDDGAVDLGSLGDTAKSFTPYVFDRSGWWMLLPIFMLFVVVMHLRKTKPKREQKQSLGNLGSPNKLMKKNNSTLVLLVATLAWLSADTASAAQFEPLGKAVGSLLGTTKAFRKVLNDGQSNVDVFYAKGPDGKASKVVFIEHAIFKPDCTHTWAIGLDAASGAVSEVRPIEMSCPHAYPTRSASFLDQFKGKGPADVATLDSQVSVVAKATGTCKLATEAVKRSITTLEHSKGKF